MSSPHGSFFAFGRFLGLFGRVVVVIVVVVAQATHDDVHVGEFLRLFLLLGRFLLDDFTSRNGGFHDGFFLVVGATTAAVAVDGTAIPAG